jgi:hypothetical protein
LLLRVLGEDSIERFGREAFSIKARVMTVTGCYRSPCLMG